MSDSSYLTSSNDHTPDTYGKSVGPGEVVLGSLVTINDDGQPEVDFAGNPTGTPLLAVTTVGVTAKDLNRQVALLFAEGNITKPIIMGLVHSPLYAILEKSANSETGSEDKDQTEGFTSSAAAVAPSSEAKSSEEKNPGVAYIDGEKVVIEGKNEVVLKCGDASITLTKTGKVLIRGKYLLNRSSGVNRILGGSVQVN